MGWRKGKAKKKRNRRKLARLRLDGGVADEEEDEEEDAATLGEEEDHGKRDFLNHLFHTQSPLSKKKKRRILGCFPLFFVGSKVLPHYYSGEEAGPLPAF